MKAYELLLILSPQFSDEELPTVLNGIFGVIKKEGGEIKQHKIVGRQALAYPIKHMKHGCYILVEIEIESSALIKINRALGLMPEILRFDISNKVSSEMIKPSFTMSRIENKEKEKDTKSFVEQTEKNYTKKIEEAEKDNNPRELTGKAPKAEIVSEPTKEEEPKPPIPRGSVEGKIPLEDLDKKLEEILNEEVL